jgi:GR25 family glycosyltransferase involved in LPS biosynthesis
MDEIRKIKLPFDKVFCLNLCERTDRRAFMESQFENLGILDQITWHEVVKHPHGNLIAKAFRDSGGSGWLNQENEYSCTREHYTMIKSSYLKGYDHILIFEDDISLLNDKDIFEKLISSIPENYDILRLCAYWDNKYVSKLSESKLGWNLDYSCFLGTSGYALNREGMRYLIDYIDSYLESADFLLFRTDRIVSSGLRMFNSNPPLAIIKDSWISRSDIQTKGSSTDLLRDPSYSRLPLDYTIYG